MSDKVKLPKEVAEAIQDFRMCYLTTSDIITQVFKVDQSTSTGETLRDFASDNFDIFLQALVNGYEVEQTPEDRVKWHYENPDSHNYNPNSWKMGIRVTLDALNIKISGINA